MFGKAKAKVPHAKAPLPLPPSSPVPQAPALQLLRAVGISCPNGAASLAHHPTSGVIALIAGCTVVLYDARSKVLGQPLSGEASKPFACVAISRCGRLLAAGQRGASPATLVFELPGGRCVASLAKGHKHGVASVAFSPDGRLLASTGCSYDGQLCVWEVRSGSLLVKQHTCAGVTSVCFSEDGGCVVTVGKEHFKAWSITQPAARHGTRLKAPLAGAGAAGLLLAPKPASLKEFKSCTFVGVQAAVPVAPGAGPTSTFGAACGGSGGVYALTSSGVLLLMRATGRTVDKSVNVQVHRAFALSVSASLVACACSSGLVRLFAARTLAFKTNLPRPAASAGRELGGLEAEGLMARSSGVELYPDAVACSFEPSGAQLAVIYSDRSLLLWDVRDTTKVSRLRSLQSHSAGIWDAAMLILPSLAPSSSSPDRPSSSLAATSGPQLQQQQPQSQPCCLVTCSADGSVRFWSLPQQRPGLSPAAAPGTAPPLEAARSLCCIQLDPPATPAAPLLKGSVKPQPLGSGALAAAPLAAAVAVRCLALSSDGAHLAVGDGDGNLRVFDLRSNGQTPQLSALREAHDAELLTLAYSTFGGGRFLATGGRDGVVHVFDRSDDYALVNTLDEHGGAAVTAVRFARCLGRGDVLLSCGADRAVVFRTVTDAQDCTVATYSREQVPAAPRTAPSPMAVAAVAAAISPLPSGTGGGGGVLYDLALDASGLLAVTVGQDAALRIWDVAAGRQLGIIRQAGAEAMAIRVALDPSGGLAACACADGSVALFDLVHAKGLVARSHGGGHGDVATSVLFAPDYQSVVSVGGDGCILQWGLPVELADRMQAANRAAAEAAAAVAARSAAAAGAGRRQQQQRQEQGSGAAARPGPPRQAWGAVPAVAAAAVPATPPPHADAEEGPAGALAAPAPAAAAVAATPSLPGGVNPELSATLRRLQQGRPLLSADKLPRWATRAPLPSFELPPDEEGAPSPSPCAGSGGGGGAAAKERSGGGAKGGGDGVAWVSRGQDPRREKRPGGEEGQREGGGPGAVPRQAWGDERKEEAKGGGVQEVETVAQEEEEEEQVVCKPVGLDPGTRFEVQAAPEPEGEEQEAGEDQEAVAEAAGAAAAAAALLASGGASNRMGGGHAGEEGHAAEAEREGEASGAAPQPRDLFREHFDTLDQVSVTQGAAAGEGDPLQQGDGDGGEGQSQSRRLSLTATYRKLALSVLRAEGVARGTGNGGAAGTAARPTERPPLPSAAAWQAAAAAVGSATPSAAPAASASLASGQHPHVTTTRGSLSLAELGAAVITSEAEGGGGGAGTPGWGAAVAAPAPAAAANCGVAAAEAAVVGFSLQQQGRQPREVAAGQNGGGALVRAPSPLPPGGVRAGGRLGGELAKMRERLEALQQQFEQQQQQGGGGGVGAGAVGWRSPRRPQQQCQQQEAASGEDAQGQAFGAAASLRLPLPPVRSAGGPSPLSLASGGVFQLHPGCSGPNATLAPAAAAGPQSSPCALRPGLQDNPMFNASPASQQTSGASPAAFAFAAAGADGGPAALVAFRNAAFSSSAAEMESSPLPVPARPMLPLAALQQQHPQQGAVAAAAAHGLGVQRPGGGTGGGSGGTGSEITLAGGAAAVGGVEAEGGGGGAAAFLSAHGGALGSPSNCTIRKKMKVTAPGFKSVLSPSNPSKFRSIGELAAAMAAESAGARAVPSSVAAEPFGHPSAAAAAAAAAAATAADPMQQQQGCSDLDASGAAAAAAGSGSVPPAFTPVRKLPASGQQQQQQQQQLQQQQQQQQQQPQGRAPDQYFAALQRLNAAAAEVAQMWGELQQDGAGVGAGSDSAAAAPPNSGLPSTAMQQQQQQQQQQPASSEGASFASAISGQASLASSASAAGARPSSQLQARFQREVGGSLQALAAVVLAPATGGAASATPPNMGLGQQQQQQQR